MLCPMIKRFLWSKILSTHLNKFLHHRTCKHALQIFKKDIVVYNILTTVYRIRLFRVAINFSTLLLNALRKSFYSPVTAPYVQDNNIACFLNKVHLTDKMLLFITAGVNCSRYPRIRVTLLMWHYTLHVGSYSSFTTLFSCTYICLILIEFWTFFPLSVPVCLLTSTMPPLPSGHFSSLPVKGIILFNAPS